MPGTIKDLALLQLTNNSKNDSSEPSLFSCDAFFQRIEKSRQAKPKKRQPQPALPIHNSFSVLAAISSKQNPKKRSTPKQNTHLPSH